MLVSKRMGSQLVSEKPKKNKPSVGPISSFVVPRPLLVDLVANVGQKEAGSSKGSPRVLHRAMLAPSAKESGPSADANLRPPVKRKYLQPPMRLGAALKSICATSSLIQWKIKEEQLKFL
ncbi:hypothetical protein Tco_0590876 [Tanacetum coccineum]